MCLERRTGSSTTMPVSGSAHNCILVMFVSIMMCIYSTVQFLVCLHAFG